MSEFNFGLQRGKLTKITVTKRDRIARKVGGPRCGYVYTNVPGLGWQGWGYAPNRGAPFDDRLAAEVHAAWDAAGVGIPHRGGSHGA